jgi:hypothetical protein
MAVLGCEMVSQSRRHIEIFSAGEFTAPLPLPENGGILFKIIPGRVP